MHFFVSLVGHFCIMCWKVLSPLVEGVGGVDRVSEGVATIATVKDGETLSATPEVYYYYPLSL